MHSRFVGNVYPDLSIAFGSGRGELGCQRAFTRVELPRHVLAHVTGAEIWAQTLDWNAGVLCVLGIVLVLQLRPLSRSLEELLKQGALRQEPRTAGLAIASVDRLEANGLKAENASWTQEDTSVR
jgi:hypothetical protein